MPDFGKLVKQVTKSYQFLVLSNSKESSAADPSCSIQVLYFLGLYDPAGMTVLEFSAANEVAI